MHDTTGPIGKLLRTIVPAQTLLGLDDGPFAAVFVVGFMQVMGILQLPEFIGPKFTPFGSDILNPWKDSTSWEVGKTESEFSKKKAKKRNRNKKKVA